MVTTIANLGVSRLGLAACGCAAVVVARRLSQRMLSSASFTLDSALFLPSAVDKETADASQAAIDAELANPSFHLTPLEKRERRFKQYMSLHTATLGEGQPARRQDRTVSHKSSTTPVGVSVFRPSNMHAETQKRRNTVRGVYLHMHGGSWLLGGAKWQNDIRLLSLAEKLDMAIVSVDYRLAPEHQLPAILDD